LDWPYYDGYGVLIDEIRFDNGDLAPLGVWESRFMCGS
jgi:hypothetical protein